MSTRIIIFGNSDLSGNLYSLYLRSKGYEVLHFTKPITCTVVIHNACTCARDHVCADIVITDMDMDDMTGLELIRHQYESGCHAPPHNKAILTSGLTKEQEVELMALGCKSLRKPFRLIDLIKWVEECEKNIQPDRKLVPCGELIASTVIELQLNQLIFNSESSQ